MRDNNLDSKFNQLLGEVASQKATSLSSLSTTILSNNGLADHKDLIDILDETPKDRLPRDLLSFARKNNDDGKIFWFFGINASNPQSPFDGYGPFYDCQ